MRRALLLTAALLVGCTAASQHQRQLGALHTQAATACKTTPARCAALKPCAAELRGALRAWQRVLRLEAGLSADPAPVPGVAVPVEDTEPPPADTSIAAADALIQETMARHLCAQEGVR